MKIWHLNSRQMVSVPEQRVTVRHPVLKAPPGEMRHTAELMNRPAADQPPRQITLHLQPPVGLTQPGADHRGGCGPAPQSHPCISACSQSSGAIRKYSSGSPEIFTQGKYLSPSGVLTTKPHDSAGAHRRACARIADSVCVMGFTAKVC